MNGMIPTLSDISGDCNLKANYEEVSTVTGQSNDSERHIAVWPELTELGKEMLSVLNGLYGIDSDEAHLVSAGA